MKNIYIYLCCILNVFIGCSATAQAQGAFLEVQGVSRPMYDANLSFSIPGNVFAIDVKPGQEVKEGEPLMHLDSRAEDSRIAQIQSEIDSTIKIRTLEARVAQAKVDMERYESALRSRAATVMESQHARLSYELSVLALEEERFRISQLHLSLQEMQAQRDKMYLYAPMDGFVESILVERGMAVDRNVVALHYVSIDPLLVELTLPIKQAERIKVGDEVEVLQPNKDIISKGKVAQVARIAVLSNRTLKVGIHVDNPQHISAGLLVTVRFPQVSVDKDVKQNTLSSKDTHDTNSK